MCTVTRGPGLLNALNAIRTAVKGERRVLIVTGDVPSRTGNAAAKNLDQGPVCESVGAAFFLATTLDAVGTRLREALDSALSGMPAVFAVDTDLLNSDCPVLPPVPPAVISASGAPGPSLDPQLTAVAESLSRARRPLIIAGEGAKSPGCRATLEALAEQSGALLGTTLLAKEFFDGSIYNLGVVGGYATDPASPLLAEVDFVIAFGASLNMYTTSSRTLFRSAMVVQVDIAADRLGKEVPIGVGIAGDSLDVARAIESRLATIGREPGARSLHLPEVLKSLAGPMHEVPDQSVIGELDPRTIVARLDTLLPLDRVVVLDSGRFTIAIGRFLPVRPPRGIRHTAEAGSIGLGLGVALGAAVGCADRTTVLFAGDGGFSMAIADLETAARHGIALIMVVINDRAYGAEMHLLESHDRPTEAAVLPEIDFAAVAIANGIEALTVSSLDQLDALTADIFKRKSPLVLNCRVRQGLFVPRLAW